MPVNWQLELPEAQGSVLCTTTQERELFRSLAFSVPNRNVWYQVRAVARWDDRCGNGSNSFYYREMVVSRGGEVESDYAGMSDVPSDILDSVPAEYRALKRWNGCHPFGPWYYMENGLYLADERDHWGLRVGEARQMKTTRDELMWELRAVDDSVPQRTVPLYGLPTLMTGDKPTSSYRLEWFPCMRVGEGKPRQLEAFRTAVIWPEATLADIAREDLSEVLKTRLPGLLREFRAVIEGLGFTW